MVREPLSIFQTFLGDQKKEPNACYYRKPMRNVQFAKDEALLLRDA